MTSAEWKWPETAIPYNKRTFIDWLRHVWVHDSSVFIPQQIRSLLEWCIWLTLGVVMCWDPSWFWRKSRLGMNNRSKTSTARKSCMVGCLLHSHLSSPCTSQQYVGVQPLVHRNCNCGMNEQNHLPFLNGRRIGCSTSFFIGRVGNVHMNEQSVQLMGW